MRSSRFGTWGKGREKECEVDGRIIVVCKDVGVKAIERESVGTECREGGMMRGRLEDKGWCGHTGGKYRSQNRYLLRIC